MPEMGAVCFPEKYGKKRAGALSALLFCRPCLWMFQAFVARGGRWSCPPTDSYSLSKLTVDEFVENRCKVFHSSR